VQYNITKALPTYCVGLESSLAVGSEFVTKEFYNFDASISLNI